MICIPDIMIQPVFVDVPPLTERPDPCAEPVDGTKGYVPTEPELPPVFPDDEILRGQRAMIEHCELLKDRVAILDPPFASDVARVSEWRRYLESKFAALYYPWIRVNDPLRIRGDITRLIPPSGHIAGVYARTDMSKGVHKAPANEEVSGATDVALMIDDSEQEVLNPEGINCLRSFPKRGVLIWGTRTISEDPVWKYVNIRRLLIMIEDSVKEAMQWAVFEPNDVYLRYGINVAVSSFLKELWRNGALAGTIAEEAYFVKCDEANNPQEVIDAGKIITDVGVAPSIPGEFIVFRIGRTEGEMEVDREDGLL
jgi:phage tail sheath protein FI